MKFLIFSFFIIFLLPISSQKVSAMTNPSSVYCIEKGFKNEIRNNPDGSQYGVCIFPDGKECEEWQFYRGECKPEITKNLLPTPIIIVGFLIIITSIILVSLKILKIPS